MSFTPNQLQAIHAPGNTLVVAGAGAGKTGTLVERCIRLVLKPENPVALRRILVVTFTEAAAAEVRERIRGRLEAEAERDPDREWIREQIASLDSANISTLHSFCFGLARDNFYKLDLDPGVTVLQQEQVRILFANTLDTLLQEHYAGKHSFSAALNELIRSQFAGWDRAVREFVQKLHDFTQTRPNPGNWFAQALEILNNPRPESWESLFREAVQEWCQWWIPYLRSLDPENTNAHACADLLAAACANPDPAIPLKICEREDVACWPKGMKSKHKPAFKKLFDEAFYLKTLLPAEGQSECPLQQDWEWSRGPLLLLLQLARQFGERFAQAKRERGAIDFHDLEQCALNLLWDFDTSAPTSLAEVWRGRLEAIFVDEYQDINAAQDLIIAAISRQSTPGAPGNRFLVGDIKQSIYRFRQADPSIFRTYLQQSDGWELATLADNFRSHEGILRFVNPLFAWLMRPEIGGLSYDESAHLKFGNPAGREGLAWKTGDRPCVELHLRISGHENEEPEEEGEPGEGTALAELENDELEARLVAIRLRELKEGGFTIFDQKAGGNRPVEWRDMVVLLRAASRKLEVYSKAFAAEGVPLQAKRNAFFTTQEVLDLCSLLQVLDNPLQDIPLVAALRSPMGALTADDLARIRIHTPRGPFWNALNAFLEIKHESETRAKVERFLNLYNVWRSSRNSSSVAQRLETILADTGYSDWLLAQPYGPQQYANIQQLLRIARQFDQHRGESLYLFLRHIQELQEAAGDIEPATLANSDAVRLMTVHQSKGLEFPVVAVADLGKQFNNSDQAHPIILDERFGLCATIKPPQANRQYPSLPLWLARRRQKIENAGEEMRILYVALTRARNHLLLFGTCPKKRTERWERNAVHRPHPQQLMECSSSLDWIGTRATIQRSDWLSHPAGTMNEFSYRIHREINTAARTAADAQAPSELSADAIQEIRQNLEFEYQHAGAVDIPSKTSVSILRRRADEMDREALDLGRKFSGRSDGQDRGVANHAFLQHLDISGSLDEAGLRRQAAKLVNEKVLTGAQEKAIEFPAITAFWSSDFGRELLGHAKFVVRELPFTFKLTPANLAAAGLEQAFAVPAGEFVTLQGVVDLAVVREQEIWLIDFKTDSIRPSDLAAAVDQYRPQISLYMVALEGIYRRTVTRKGIYFMALKQLQWL